MAAVSRSQKQSHVGQKNPYSLVTKPYFIETESGYAGTCEEVRLRGQFYAAATDLLTDQTTLSTILVVLFFGGGVFVVLS